MDELEFKLQEYMTCGNQIRHPTVVVFVVQKESVYPQFKELMLKYRMPS
jgi:hypothetical protein